jgi:hypothetical protein
MSLDAADGLDAWSLPQSRSVKAIPFMLSRLETLESRPSSRDQSFVEEDNPFMRRLPTPSQMSLSDEAMGLSPTNNGSGAVVPTQNGRNDPNSAWEQRRSNLLLPQQSTTSMFSLSRSESQGKLPNKSSEGLLARQLRGLSVEREKHAEQVE